MYGCCCAVGTMGTLLTVNIFNTGRGKKEKERRGRSRIS